mgnify:CR=1 FL=1
MKYTPNPYARRPEDAREPPQGFGPTLKFLGPGLIQSRPLAPGQEPINRDGRVAEAPETVVPAALWLAQQTAENFTGRVVHRDEFGDKWP